MKSYDEKLYHRDFGIANLDIDTKDSNSDGTFHIVTTSKPIYDNDGNVVGEFTIEVPRGIIEDDTIIAMGTEDKGEIK